jgi:hypothetical protein
VAVNLLTYPQHGHAQYRFISAMHDNAWPGPEAFNLKALARETPIIPIPKSLKMEA